jgi:hypothetical protein
MGFINFFKTPRMINFNYWMGNDNYADNIFVQPNGSKHSSKLINNGGGRLLLSSFKKKS